VNTAADPAGDEPLEIPVEGLQQVLRVWLGRGELAAALGGLHLSDLDREWAPADTAKRIAYVRAITLRPLLRELPVTLGTWIDMLPARSVTTRETSMHPSAATDWVATRRRFGWPPRELATRTKRRAPDSLLSTVIAWLVDELAALELAATAVEPAIFAEHAMALSAARRLREQVIPDAFAVAPTPPDLLAIEREGRGWLGVATVVRSLRADLDNEELATALLRPFPEMRPLFFHLGVLGTILAALAGVGATIVSVAPIGRSRGRPSFRVTRADTTWDLWVEAAGIGAYYGRRSPYRALTAPVPGAYQPLSPDILLVRPGRYALVVECKYSRATDYVGRRALGQVSLYATDLTHDLAPVVDAFVVAPENALGGASNITTRLGCIGVLRPGDLAATIDHCLSATAGS
jgi:hypothetical protein